VISAGTEKGRDFLKVPALFLRSQTGPSVAVAGSGWRALSCGHGQIAAVPTQRQLQGQQVSICWQRVA